MAVCFAPLFPQNFSLRSALKNTLEKTFSTCIRLHFSASFILFSSPFLFLRVHERQIISLSYMDISKTFCGGVLQKFFTPLTIIGKLRAVCWGISRKFYKKNCREIFPTTAYKKEVRYYSNFLLLFWLFCQIIFDTSVSRSIRNIDSETVYL